jgi:hypothetical protein
MGPGQSTDLKPSDGLAAVGGARGAPSFSLPPIPSMAHQRLEGGAHHASLYIAGATHMRDFCQPLGITAFKVGITGNRDAQARIEDLRRKRYGSLLLTPDQTASGRKTQDDAPTPSHPADLPPMLASANEWFLIPLSPDWLAGFDIPEGMSLIGNTVAITVPSGITTEALDKAVHDLLRPRSLRTYLQTDEGRNRMVAAGRDPAAWLHTSYSLMTEKHRISAAEEIYLLRPRRELPALVTALGGLLKGLKVRPD